MSSGIDGVRPAIFVISELVVRVAAHAVHSFSKPALNILEFNPSRTGYWKLMLPLRVRIATGRRCKADSFSVRLYLFLLTM
jgi:hypothetical protein